MTVDEKKRRIARAMFYITKMTPGGQTWSMLRGLERARWIWIADVVYASTPNVDALIDRLEAIARINR